nr:Periplasmic protein TonB [Ipomoea batatas]
MPPRRREEIPHTPRTRALSNSELDNSLRQLTQLTVQQSQLGTHDKRMKRVKSNGLRARKKATGKKFVMGEKSDDWQRKSVQAKSSSRDEAWGAIPPPPPATASRQIPTQSSICCAADLELESVAVDRKPEAASVDREPEAASIDCELEAVAADREPESTVADREPESTVADREPESTVADRSESIKARLLLIKPLAAELRWVGVGRKALRHGVSCCTSHAADENCASAKSSD